jgi:hypothetical protein
MFVEDMYAIVGSSRVTDRILVLGDFNLPKVEWGVQEDGSTLMPMDISTDLELCFNLGQIVRTLRLRTANRPFLDSIIIIGRMSCWWMCDYGNKYNKSFIRLFSFITNSLNECTTVVFRISYSNNTLL